MLKRALSVLFVLFVPVVLPAVVRGQVRVGPEYQVNAYIGGNQRAASVATDTAGNFVVVWQGRDGNGYGVFARWHDTSGIPLGSAEFQVNTYTPGSQTVPSVAATPGGQVVVVWQSDEQDGSLAGIFARQYDAAGTPLGPEFPVNTYTTSGQSRPSVASDESGNFVVVWQSYGQDGSLEGIFARQYDAGGAPRGPEFPVNIHTTFGQSRPSVASDASGNFVVVWQSLQDGDHQGDVFAQRFDSTGARVGGEFMVNNYTTSAQTEPAVTSDALGNFVVAWASRQDASASYDVFAQRYDAAGTTVGGEFGVNAYTADDQRFPKVAIAPNGFVVVWESNGQDGSLGGSFGRRYDTRGTPEGPEFQLNTYTTDDQLSAAVASDGSGRFLTVWNSRGQDGSGNGIFGQRFLTDVIFRDGFEDGTLLR